MEPVRLVPEWTVLRSQLREKLKMQKSLLETAEDVMLTDRPSILFRESCYPSLMPLIGFYSSGSTSYFTSFSLRGTKGSRSKVHVWAYTKEVEPPVAQKDYAMEEEPEVLLLTHVPNRNLFVAYCNDLHLRLFGDHTQDLRLLSDKLSPYSITSMCYNPEMCELVTGAIGMLAFWAFDGKEVPTLSIMQSVSILSGEFVHFLSVERERKALVALCENVILIFDYHSKVKMHAFQVSQGVSLICCATNWLQSCLYAGDLAGEVKVWNFDTGSQTNQFTAHLSAIVSMVSRASVHTLMTASLDGLMKEWDLTTCELLRRVDIGEQVFQMEFISEQTFFIRTQHTFSIRTVNNFYQLFNRPNSVLKKLVRIQCGPEKARLLATTEDGAIHFLSPVTGEMLFVTWPFKQVEKALDYVYDPDREELLVTVGTADVYALDTTRNPCPCKYILRATDSKDDKVLCLAYIRLNLGGHTTSFIFSGYKSGRVQSITRHLYRNGSRRIHDGNVLALSSLSASWDPSNQSRESSFLCSYGSDEYIILSDVVLKKSALLELEPLVCIPSIHYRINHLLLIPGYICVMTEQNRVRLWRQSALVPGKKNPFWKETAAMHSSSITSFDYCHRLGMLVTGGSDGSVRLWDILGHMLVEFDTSLRFSRVCFANQRGDLVVGCNKNIYFISCVTYLPRRHLSKLVAQQVKDDAVERPLPFLPHFLLRFDTVFVPKYHRVVKRVMEYDRLEPISNPKEVGLEKGLVRVVERAGMDASALPLPDFYDPAPATKDALRGLGSKQKLMPQVAMWLTPEKKPLPTGSLLLPPPPYDGLPALHENIRLRQRVAFKAGRSWPIAPDGYVPNSVIRAVLYPDGTPEALQCTLLMTRQALPQRHLVQIPWEQIDLDKYAQTKKARKKKMLRSRHAAQAVLERQSQRDLLADIVSKPWLRHKPSEMTLPSVVKAILDLMDDVPYSIYLMCTAALVQLAETYTLAPEVQDQAFERLIQDTTHKEVRMKVAAWEALGKMGLLEGKDIVPLAKALLDEDKQVRDLARSLLDSVAGITDKFALKKEVHRLAKCSLADLTIGGKLSEMDFPRRLREAGIVAKTPDHAVDALKEVSQKLVFQMEKQLTANLFLMDDRIPEDDQDEESLLPPRRRRGVSVHSEEEDMAEEAEAQSESETEAPTEAKARWLGLFDTVEKKSPRLIAIEAVKRRQAEKLPKIQPAVEQPPAGILSAELLSESSASSSSSTASTSSPTWQKVPRQQQKGRWDQREAKPTVSPSQEDLKLAKTGKAVQPIPLQRQDTRMQLYTEMLKRQQRTVKKERPVAPPPAAKQESPVAPKPQEAPRGSLIDPKREYSMDKSKWRTDLLKLLMLRIGPSLEGRTAMEALLASARVALGGRSMSWELFASIGQSLLASKGGKAEKEATMMQQMAELFKTSPWQSWPKLTAESRETVLDVKMGREIRRTSVSESESMSSMSRSSLEQTTASEVPGEEPVAEKGGAPQEAGKEKKLTARVKQSWKKATLFTTQVKRMAGKKETTEKEEEEEEEEEGEEEEEEEEEGGGEKEDKRGLVRGSRRSAVGEPIRGREEDVAQKTSGEKLATAKEHEAGKRGEWEAVERKAGKRLWQAAARKRVRRREPRINEEEEPASEEGRTDSEEVAALAESVGSLFSELVEKALVEGEEGEPMMSARRERVLSEARELALADLREESLAEGRERLLEEMMEQAEAEARRRVLAEVREKALAGAREQVLVEARESALAEARGRFLAEARERALAEGLEGEPMEARMRQLADEELRMLSEATLRTLAEEWLKKVEEATPAAAGESLAELIEAKAVELANAQVGQMTEAQIAELTEAKLLELAEAEEKESSEAEARLWELLVAKIRERAKATARELAERKLRELAKRRQAQKALRSKLFTPKSKEAEMREASGEEEEMLLSESKAEALVAAFQEEQRSELSHSAHAQVLLDILTKPERLESSGSKLYLRLFQVLSLLKIPSGLSCQELTEFLLYKADQIAMAGEEEDKRLAKETSPVYVELKKAVQALEPTILNTKESVVMMKPLWRAARALLQARALKEQLERGFQAHKALQEEEEEGRGRGKKTAAAWESQRLREAIKKWQLEQLERAEKEALRAWHPKLRPELFQVRAVERRVERPQARREAETADEQPQPITWSMRELPRTARRATVRVEEQAPLAKERREASGRQRQRRLPKDALYLPKQAPRKGPHHEVRRHVKRHIFRPPEQTADWEVFSTLYQSLLTLEEEEGELQSQIWHGLLCRLLDLYGLKDPSIRALVQQLLTDDYRPPKALPAKDLLLREGEANPGERILCHVTPCSAGPPPTAPTRHGVLPLSYQNNVHPFNLAGANLFGALCLRWKTSSCKGKGPDLHF